MLVKESRERADEMAEINRLLRSQAPDWEAISTTVERVSHTVTATTPTEQGRIDPYLYRTVSDAMLRLWPAVAGHDRRAARLAAEAVRQALADIADAADREGPRDPKQTAAWVADVAGDLDNDTVQTLFGVSYRTWRRWIDTDGTAPTGESAARLWTVAGALEHLRRAYTPAGALSWFHRPHPQLDGHTPAELLDDPTAHQRLVEIAAGSRVSVAA